MAKRFVARTSACCKPSRRAVFSSRVGAVVATLTLIATPSLATAAGFYVGASGGQAWLDASAGEIENAFALDDAFRASDTKIDDSDTGWKAYVGYRFNPYFAIEGGYVDLGEASFQTTITDAPPPYSAFTPFRIEGIAEATGYNLVAIVGVPLGSAGFVFVKAGAFRWDADFTERVPELGATRLTRSESDTKPTYGVGLELKLWEAVRLRAELERFEEVGAGIGGREGADIDLASAGLIFQF
jgi:OOP family OmpA-OmpF porin